MDNEQIKKPIVRFPNYKSIVDRVFGAGNLDSFEYEEAEALVSLAKEELLKDLMREAVEGEICIPNVWVEHKEGKELVARAEISKELGFKFGDKVRIIIVKED